jgi:lysyl-tRNA synthetase class 1
VEEWLSYATPESLALYMFQKPKTAKRLFFDVIPKAVDEYLAFLDAYHRQTPAERLENAVWHIHSGRPPQDGSPVTFALLLNLVSAANAETNAQIWSFISKYAPDASPATSPLLDQLVGYALRYYQDFVKPTKRFRAAAPMEVAAFLDLAARFDALDAGLADGEALQNIVFEVGKAHGFEPLRDWFKALYEVLLGQEQGPRFGSFAAIFGVRETADLLRKGAAGELLAA